MKKAFALFSAAFLGSYRVGASEIKYSDPQTIKYTDELEGDMTFTYSTYLDGEAGFKVPYLKGKIEITDRQEKGTKFKLTAQGKEYLWEDSVWKDDPAVDNVEDSKQVRVAIEFGLPGREKEYREQVRFILHVKEGKDSKFTQEKIQYVKDFNGTDLEPSFVYPFILLEENSPAVETRDVHGYKITGQSFDPDTKKLTLEFVRPFDVTYDFSFFLQPLSTYKMHILWGAFKKEQKGLNFASLSKGMKAVISDDKDLSYNKGQDWTLPKPPGWDELLATQNIKLEDNKEKDADKVASGAIKTSISIISALLLGAITYY